MADGFVQIAPDSSGKKVDVEEIIRQDASAGATSAFTTIERERVSLADEGGALQIQTRLLHEIVFELQQLRLALLDALH
jgi:hypothetical protein